VTTRDIEVVVIGAGGSQAQAMLEGAARAGSLSRWLAVDRAWRDGPRANAHELGVATDELDILDDRDALVALLSRAEIVANLAGPYYRTGTAVLDAAIEAGTDYLDICDDADVVLPMLDRDKNARQRGVRAMIGMGSSPGTTNVLIRAAIDHLGPVDAVDIHWTVDVDDITDAAVRHFWHCFNLVDPDGQVHAAPGWDDLDRKLVTFPGTVGIQSVVRLAHPEPLTIPRFLPVKRSSNYGSITPSESFVVAWALAYAVDPQRLKSTQALDRLVNNAVELFGIYRDTRPRGTRTGSGLLIDVHTDGTGLRFSSGAHTEMAEATGIPAAAGIYLMLDGRTPPNGVFAPETLQPADFFEALRRVSRGGGGLTTHRIENGIEAERVRLRDIIATASHSSA
jgi:saccharopine dehydrogenase (NAD+, L-lysine-forming)